MFNILPSSLIRTLKIMSQLFKRDFYRHRKQLFNLIINNGLLRPALFTFTFAFIQNKVMFSGNAQLPGTLLMGSALLIIIIFTYVLAADILFDLENNRFIIYQTTLLNPRLVLLERIIFSTLYTSTMMLPFFIFTTLFMYPYLDNMQTNWLSLTLITIASSWCLSAYHHMALCIVPSSDKIINLWMRFTTPLLILGGRAAPLYTIRTYGAPWIWLAQLNPFIYVTEGLRQAYVGGDQFLSITHCAIALTLYGITFTITCWHVFKKRIDHI
jgi:ABC-type polysaccharide/polyol phosphate export permease